MERYCSTCGDLAGTLYMDGELWLCRHCVNRLPPLAPYFKEMGTANPSDPGGSTAHVQDIRKRRWHPTEKRLFYYEPPKAYFFPKG